jgi:hypothetical protein
MATVAPRGKLTKVAAISNLTQRQEDIAAAQKANMSLEEHLELKTRGSNTALHFNQHSIAKKMAEKQGSTLPEYYAILKKNAQQAETSKARFEINGVSYKIHNKMQKSSGSTYDAFL